MPNHSWDVSRSFVMTEKQRLGFSVSWSHELWPEKGLNQAKFSTAFNQKNILLHDIESIDSLQNHAESFMGCVKIICDD
jgi:hypothetical protein